MEITDALQIPDGELIFTFARSGGPGGQNVNKVASKAILHWDLAANTSLPADVRERLRARQRRRVTTEGELVIQGQRFRDQAKNIDDCRDRLREMVLEALAVPKAQENPAVARVEGTAAHRQTPAGSAQGGTAQAERGGMTVSGPRLPCPSSAHSGFAECSGRPPTRFSPLCRGPVHRLPFHGATGSGVGIPTHFAHNRTGEMR